MSKKRKRRRPGAGPPPQPKPKKPAIAEQRAAAAKDERPPAPWGSFPLVEIAVLVGIVLLVVGFVIGGDRGTLAIIVGLGLCSLAGLEIAIREHFAGFRSHSVLLAGFGAVALMALLFYAGPDSVAKSVWVAVGVGVFGGGAWALAQAFRRRAGVRVKLR